ncbi:tyrosine--tRNA ligase [Candidatus Woesearchaeota archaeon]|jgi:tyrosyl-tRNA synthetase|nr:tyrosine--tRNA ligase [Candidatus Woesearchaeota archaeon]MBT5396849.1 tyrosine--tRNA ligase [Candidatus Woesearchaeota archaeon]MBT5924544.1 tyrosine--tRNA ligase [Candidatus Woesearchaeota archaeon]MBT7762862.1 tyrosine--tRNA ligase [Candidatus Woesearchaeota archaeon]
MTPKEKLEIIKEVGEEILTEDELLTLLTKKKKLVAYDGFEPSGRIHIAQGLLRAININKLVQAGITFKMLVADWHGWANNKMGGDLDKIQTVGKYFIEVWKACGLDTKNVEFIWASDLLNNREYWKTVMSVARHSTLNRILRTTQIMGRTEKDTLQASHIFYPCMQTADIFHLKADICQLGLDQRKVNVLARELGPKLGFWKPIAVHHHMLMGLTEPKTGGDTVDRAIAMKMSKSNPNSAIFMTDSEDDINKKMRKAYCPEKQADDNPILEYCKYIIFEKFDTFTIERPDKFGGNVSFSSYAELEKAFVAGDVHPADLKNSAAEYINMILVPVRKHFETNKNAKKLKDLVESYQVTR